MTAKWLKSFHRLFLISSTWRVVALISISMLYLIFGSIVLEFLDVLCPVKDTLKARMTSHVLIRRYGNAKPAQSWGILVMIIYLHIGYPIQIIITRLLGLHLRSYFRRILKKIKELKWRYLPESCHYHAIDFYLTEFLFFFVMGVIFVFGPSAIFERFEDWSYTEGLYFSIMTVCSIGFGDYAAGLFILDRLDGKYDKRKAAREEESNLYNLVADINWKLAKYCPEEFTKQRVYQEFLKIYINSPEKITGELMQELHQTSEELRIITSNKLLNLNLSKGPKCSSLFKIRKKESMSVSTGIIHRTEFHETRGEGRLTNPGLSGIPIEKLEPVSSVTDVTIGDLESGSERPSSLFEIEKLLHKIDSDKKLEFKDKVVVDQLKEEEDSVKVQESGNDDSDGRTSKDQLATKIEENDSVKELTCKNSEDQIRIDQFSEKKGKNDPLEIEAKSPISEDFEKKNCDDYLYEKVEVTESSSEEADSDKEKYYDKKAKNNKNE